MQRGLERFLRERPPVTARDLARFLELLFDRDEREEAGGERAAPGRAGSAPPDRHPGPDVAGLAAEAVRHRRMRRKASHGLTDEQAQFYRQTLEMTKKGIEELNVQIEEELAKVKDRLADLQAKKNAAKQIYDGACKILGIENDLEKSEEADA